MVYFECTLCGHWCQDQREQDYHLSTHVEAPRFACTSCDHVADSLEDLKRHKTQQHSHRHRCPFCPYSCQSALALADHCGQHDRPILPTYDEHDSDFCEDDEAAELYLRDDERDTPRNPFADDEAAEGGGGTDEEVNETLLNTVVVVVVVVVILTYCREVTKAVKRMMTGSRICQQQQDEPLEVIYRNLELTFIITPPNRQTLMFTW